MTRAMLFSLALAVCFCGCKDRGEPKMFWYNAQSDTLHNKSCKYYGHTRGGYYTDEVLGTDCGRCGGAGFSYRRKHQD